MCVLCLWFYDLFTKSAMILEEAGVFVSNGVYLFYICGGGESVWGSPSRHGIINKCVFFL